MRCIYFSALPLGSLPEQSCYCSSLNAEAAVCRWSLRILHEENRVRSYLFLSSRVKELKLLRIIYPVSGRARSRVCVL